MKTTLYTVLCVVIRLGAVLMAVRLIEGVPVFLWGSPDRVLSTIALGFTALGLLVAGALWFWPGLLAWWAANRQNGEVLESTMGAGQMQYIAFSVMGCWLLISGLANGLQQGITLLMMHAEIYPSPALSPALPANILVGLIKSLVIMIAGASLMLGSHGLVGLLHRLRGYPHNTIAEADPDAGIAQDR
ncbi:MAG: hypothetical protein WAM90_15375 [Rhodanobacter sp.]